MGKSRGFTLIELMVTIAIFSIIAMMAVPAFGNMMLAQNFNKSTQELVSTLNEARAKAVLERREITVKLNNTLPSPNTPTQLNWLPIGESILKTGSPTEIVFGLTGGVFIKDPSDSTKWIPQTVTTTFTICNQYAGSNRKSKTVSISRMGTIQQITEGTC
ncbi:GspH/FimT family pseudopilin [bacterium SPL81]|nr:GspH/FimT family pseudopilin [Acinetobacter baumannii]